MEIRKYFEQNENENTTYQNWWKGGAGRHRRGEITKEHVLSGFLWFHKNMNIKIDQIVPFKYVKLYPLNMYSLLYVNYSSTKLFLKSHWKVDSK